MSLLQDQAYLLSDQYKDACNLDARIQLHERFSQNPYGWFRWVFDQLKLPDKAHVLEIGCGSGALWSHNQARLTPGWKIILSDLSPGMIASCRKNFSIGDQAAFEIADAAAIPFAAGTFDAVIANHMLYHLPDRPKALKEITRVLMPGGCLYAATNGEKHLIELDEIIAKSSGIASWGLFESKSSADFTLENGASQLAPYFTGIDVRKYEDALLVTEAEPLLRYIYSMAPRIENQAQVINRFALEGMLRRLLAQHGCIHIQKSSGIIVGRK